MAMPRFLHFEDYSLALADVDPEPVTTLGQKLVVSCKLNPRTEQLAYETLMGIMLNAQHIQFVVQQGLSKIPFRATVASIPRQDQIVDVHLVVSGWS
jgi:hypothetical protein